jgi:hypothetical protein
MTMLPRYSQAAVLLVLCAASVSCRDPNPRAIKADVAAGAHIAWPDTGLRLAVWPVSDTIAVTGPAEIVVAVANGDSARAFRNEPDRFGYRVTFVDSGTPVDPVVNVMVGRMWGTATDVTLPATGFVGRVVDLRCVRPGIAGFDDCEYGYPLDQRGAYQVIAIYHAGTGHSPEPVLADTTVVVVQ